uniref:Uncharacterized protein n=1 Tax=Anopheles atroparvus TaxID=41427 RepID=A0A182IUP7_ANOAO
MTATATQKPIMTSARRTLLGSCQLFRVRPDSLASACRPDVLKSESAQTPHRLRLLPNAERANQAGARQPFGFGPCYGKGYRPEKVAHRHRPRVAFDHCLLHSCSGRPRSQPTRDTGLPSWFNQKAGLGGVVVDERELAARLRAGTAVGIVVLVAKVHGRSDDVLVGVDRLHEQAVAAVQAPVGRHRDRLGEGRSGRVQADDVRHLAPQVGTRDAGDVRAHAVPHQRHLLDAEALGQQALHELAQIAAHLGRVARGQIVLHQRERAPVNCADIAPDQPDVVRDRLLHPGAVDVVGPAVRQEDDRLRWIELLSDPRVVHAEGGRQETSVPSKDPGLLTLCQDNDHQSDAATATRSGIGQRQHDPAQIRGKSYDWPPEPNPYREPFSGNHLEATNDRNDAIW